MQARVGFVGCLVASTAFAQEPEQVPEPPPPPDPPVTTPAPAPVPTPAPTPAVEEQGYPRSLVQRPLLLPANTVEATAIVGVQRTTLGSDSIELYLGELRVRYGIGAADFEAGGSVLIADSYPDMFMVETETFRSAFAGGRFLMATDTTVGVQFSYNNFGSNAKQYQPRVVATTKRHLTPKSAIEFSVLGGIDYLKIDDMDGASTYVGTGEIKVQAQAAPTVGFEGRAALSYLHLPESMFAASSGHALGQNYGVRVVASMTPKIDVVGAFDLLYSGNANQYQLGVGVAGRMP
jgi:hypothetical protein